MYGQWNFNYLDRQGIYIVKHLNFPNKFHVLNTDNFIDFIISTLDSFQYVLQIFYSNK